MVSDWADFLNPDIVRARLLRTGLYLVGYEMLLGSIINRTHDFFANSWTVADGWKTNSDYRERVLSLDPKGKKDSLRASIEWLREIGAINECDHITIRELTEERNRLAHELGKVLGGTIDHDFEGLFPKLVSLVAKIDRWWIMNVEIAIDPELAATDLGEDDVTPGSLMLLQILSKVALGNDEEAWALYHELTSASKERGS